MAFLREYPESPLAHAAVRRIARMRGGDVPEEAERLWRRAMTLQAERRRAEERSRSLCAPECLAELLARKVKSKKVKGKSGSEGVQVLGSSGVQEDRAHDPATSPPHHPTAEELAREMKTDHRGTTLQSLAEAARRHGFEAKGLRLTFKGLMRQRTPLIALVQPGHFVIVERFHFSEVEVWDPSGAAPGGAVRRRLTREEWEGIWDGIALALR
jgi:hypothetical protein